MTVHPKAPQLQLPLLHSLWACWHCPLLMFCLCAWSSGASLPGPSIPSALKIRFQPVGVAHPLTDFVQCPIIQMRRLRGERRGIASEHIAGTLVTCFLELVHTDIPFFIWPQLGCCLPLEREAGSLRCSFREWRKANSLLFSPPDRPAGVGQPRGPP